MILQKEEVEVFLMLDGFTFSECELNRHGRDVEKCKLCAEKPEHTVFFHFGLRKFLGHVYIDYLCSKHLKECLKAGWKEV